MKLGLWNRLAIVATGLACLIVPAWIWLDIADDIGKSRQAWFELCMEMADQKPEPRAASAAREECYDDLGEPYGLGWDEWWQFLVGTLIGCIILYALIWAIVWVVKWVWRGRAEKNTG